MSVKRERKDRKKEQDKQLLKWAEIRCEAWADNRDYLEFDLLIFRIFFALFVPFRLRQAFGATSFAAIPVFP